MKTSKYCSLCCQDKSTHEFSKSASSKDLLQSRCKSCCYIQNLKYKDEYKKKYKGKYKEKDKERYLKNRTAQIERVKQWRQKNKDKANAYHKKYCSKPKTKIKRNLRKRIKGLLFKKGAAYDCNVGCSRKELINYLESKMLLNMTWENYGKKDGWCVDHVQPLDSFDLTQKDQRNAANHFSNLQPLWHSHNEKKSKNYDPDHPMGWRGLNSLLSEEDKQMLSQKFGYRFE